MSSKPNAAPASAAALTNTALLFCASVVTGILLSKKASSLGTATNDKVTLEESPVHEEKNVTVNQQNNTKEESVEKNEEEQETIGRILTPGNITIAYASTTGTCYKMAHKLHDQIIQLFASANKEGVQTQIQIQPIHKFDWWDEFLNDENNNNNAAADPNNPPVLILLLPTWTNGTLPPPVAKNKSLETPFPNLLDSLHEITTDWRVPKKALSASNLTLSVFGLGSSEYDPKTFCKPAKDIHRLLIGKLGAKRLLVRNDTNATTTGKRNWNLSMGDESVGDVEETVFQQWMEKVVDGVSETFSLSSVDKNESDGCGCGKPNEDTGCCKSASNPQADHTSGGSASEDDLASSDEEESDDEDEPDVIDMEDMGNSMKKSSSKANPSEPPEMVTKKQAIALKKEGYKLIGTHSAVKLCRWTKHQLRGRGGCYKHTFYGITSYQCMEATPSLACANKCEYFLSFFVPFHICVSLYRR